MRDLGNSLNTILRKIRKAGLVDKALVEEVVADLETSLLAADVKVDLVVSLAERVRKRAISEELAPGISRRDYVVKVVYDELTSLLGRRHRPLSLNPSETSIFLFVGIQGSGKTSAIAKMARYHQKRGFSVGVVGADTYRPGALQQLQQLLAPHSIEVFGDENEKDSLRVAKRGIDHFEKQTNANLILIDTAGRHKDEKGLLKEMENLAKNTEPTEVILVIDGTIGQQAYIQADAFNRTTEIGSIIVTKLDGTAKGGGAISAVAATGCRIRFIGEGEGIDDIEDFDPNRFLARLLGMTDLKQIVDRIEEAGLLVDQEELISAIKKGKLNLRHFKIQMERTRDMGSLRRLVTMIPGISNALPMGIETQSKENLQRFTGILSSMTEEELENPKLLNRSRIERVAKGSGTSVADVRQLLKSFEATQAMIKHMRGARRRRGPLGGQIPGVSPDALDL